LQKLLTALVIIVSMATTGAVYAQNFQRGYDAYKAEDYTAALQEWKPLAWQGNAAAQTNLGLMYWSGRGVVRDYGEAVKWWRKAALQGNADAQHKLGVMYLGGTGVTQDKREAFRWLHKAAEQGHAGAQNDIEFINEANATSAEEKKAREANKQSRPKQEAKRPEPKKSPPPKAGTTGSGFFVSKRGHILTNEHVIRQCSTVTVGDNANKQVTASVLETDRRNDLALLRISSTKMASAETKFLISRLGLRVTPLASEGLVRSEDVDLGEDVLVAGFPYGDLYSNTIKVTKGIVSAVKGMSDDSGQFQMDAAVQHGNSGGPIYDEYGNIVGVVVAQLNKLKVAKVIGSLPENVNFGIKASTVKQFLTSAGIPAKWSNRTERKSTKELAQIAKSQTLMVVCHP